MKVRITHGQGSFWYEHKVGEVFEVEDDLSFGDYRVKGQERNIAKEDCEEIEETHPEIIDSRGRILTGEKAKMVNKAFDDAFSDDEEIGPSKSTMGLMLN